MLKNFKLIIWLAYKEFFTLKYCRKCANSWDFPRLVLLLTLTISLVFFAIGTKHSLLDNLAEVLLAKLPNSGIPIWINSNVGGGSSKIDNQAMLKLSELNLDFHPYEDVDKGKLRLPSCLRTDNKHDKSPSCKLWHNKNPKRLSPIDSVPIFTGIAIFSDDPLWNFSFIEKNKSTNLSIVLSLEQFKSFDFEAYINELKYRLPKEYLDKLPSKQEFFSSNYNGVIWMSLGQNPKMRQLVPMSVQWVNHIPVSGNYAFLLPMEIYQSLLFSEEGGIVFHYYPDSKNQLYVKEISIPIGDKISNVKFKRLGTCLQQANSKDKPNKKGEDQFQVLNIEKLKYGSIQYALNPPKSENWVHACLNDANISICKKVGMGGEDGCPIIQSVSDKKASIQYTRMKNGAFSFTINDVNEHKTYDLLENLGSFYQGFLYVHKVDELSDIVKKMEKSFANNPFQFHEMYKDALNRFNALQTILNVMGNSYFIIMMVFSLSLLVVMFWVVIDHRKHNYYIYMTKGMSLGNIKLLLSIQSVLASLIAVFISIIIIWLFSIAMSYFAYYKLERYKNILISTDINLLPIGIWEYVGVFLISSIISVVLCRWLLNIIFKKSSK